MGMTAASLRTIENPQRQQQATAAAAKTNPIPPNTRETTDRKAQLSVSSKRLEKPPGVQGKMSKVVVMKMSKVVEVNVKNMRKV